MSTPVVIQQQPVSVTPSSGSTVALASGTTVSLASGATVALASGASVAGLPYPAGAVPVTATSGIAANAAASATLAGAAGKTTYIAGFEVTGSGALAGLPVTVTVTGCVSGTLSYVFAAVAGVLLADAPLLVAFSPEVPASAAGTAIVVSCPALGAGNTACCVNARGYQL